VTSPWRALVGLSVTVGLFAGAPHAAPAADRHPNQLVILSTTDVVGKTSPCGCHTPKGGLSRQASFADSIRRTYASVLFVDGGAYFPENKTDLEFAPFLMDAMKKMGVQVVGMSERELRFGAGYFRAQLARSGLNATCANLLERPSGRTFLPPSALMEVGGAKVGVVALMTPDADLGPSHDSLGVEDPTVAARRTIADLRKRGATVIVVLSQLGRDRSEKLATAVDGIDFMVIGHQAAFIQRGRMIGKTLASYGGIEGQFMGFARLTLDAAHHVGARESEMVMLGAEVGERADVLASVKAFEEAFNAKQAKIAMDKSNQQESDAGATDHYVGAEICARCHSAEYTQWSSTPHAHAWQALQEAGRDATPDCIVCHAVGRGQPGGFQNPIDTPGLINVQCENCHGMGTEHEAFRASEAVVAESTCRGCHNPTTSPTFDFSLYRPHILHDYHGPLKPIPESPVQQMKRMHGHGG